MVVSVCDDDVSEMADMEDISSSLCSSMAKTEMDDIRLMAIVKL